MIPRISWYCLMQIESTSEGRAKSISVTTGRESSRQRMSQELLRITPGQQLAQINGQQWCARGPSAAAPSAHTVTHGRKYRYQSYRYQSVRASSAKIGIRTCTPIFISHELYMIWLKNLYCKFRRNNERGTVLWRLITEWVPPPVNLVVLLHTSHISGFRL